MQYGVRLSPALCNMKNAYTVLHENIIRINGGGRYKIIQSHNLTRESGAALRADTGSPPRTIPPLNFTEQVPCYGSDAAEWRFLALSYLIAVAGLLTSHFSSELAS